jgi:hypothetical protein
MDGAVRGAVQPVAWFDAYRDAALPAEREQFL